jgi:RNA polymerase sigma-70 factor (ECF subfamily)
MKSGIQKKDEFFENLYSTKRLKVKHFCMRYFRNGFAYQTCDIDDIVNEVFIKFYMHSDSYRGESSVDTFLLSIAKNHCLNFIRSSHMKKREGINVSLNSESNASVYSDSGSSVYRDPRLKTQEYSKIIDKGRSALDLVITKDTMKIILNAIESLGEMDRNVILDICVEKLSYNDAAEHLCIPVNTVRSRLGRAKIKLRSKLRMQNICLS